MTKPNFLIIGAAKCGTDSLYSYLAQHPQIYLSPNKEPMFFVARDQAEIPYRGPGDREALEWHGCWINTDEKYLALFGGVSAEKAVGEASTWYLYHEAALPRIHEYLPSGKLIAILRNPVDRAYSAYTMLRRDGRETVPDFSRALDAEDGRVQANWEPIWHYRRMGFYAAQLERYYATFNSGQIHVVLSEDLAANAGEVARDLFRFLEVDDTFEPDVSERRNVSFVPRNPTYYTLVAGRNPVKGALKAVLPSHFRCRVKSRLLDRNLVRPAPIAPALRRELIDIYRPDILKLQDLIGRDLSRWLAG